MVVTLPFVMSKHLKSNYDLNKNSTPVLTITATLRTNN